MLSQHLALDIYKLYNLSYINKNSNELEISSIKNLLIKNSKEMLNANEILSTGKSSDKTIYILSNNINNIYFGDMNLAFKVKNYNKIVETALNSKNEKDFLDALTNISNQSESLLIDLNSTVLQYQKEGEEKIKDIKSIETFIWILTFIILSLEIFFIFRPLAKYIVELTDSKNSILNSMQNEIEARTLHLRNANDKLKDLAYYDPLTGLRNRFTLENDLEFLLKNYKENNISFSALVFDIDFFKNINDTYGHDLGDLVLTEISKLFIKSFRENDKIYRTGGEEFVILLNKISLENSSKIAQNTIDLVANYDFISDDIKIKTTISCGLFHSSICPINNYKNIVKFADIALYKAKNSGRNNVQIYKKD
jgi:diguanylate cyclase (GGDEF)-like protein